MNTADELDLAADLIETRGWTQNQGWGIDTRLVVRDDVSHTTPLRMEDMVWESYVDETGPVCLEGGIWAVVRVGVPGGKVEERQPFESCAAYQAVVRYLDNEEPAWQWNDSPGRTKVEVIAALRGAALMVRAEESAAATV